ncbi:class I SAM-dependent methyltransferase [Streptantibioticus parmotrematis]|uniref:class I SAM-dependent methyltransferase n=1 Tax=Streptantibioticus parmotrematis TaxID=2873249 RepID=UPI0033FB78AE
MRTDTHHHGPDEGHRHDHHPGHHHGADDTFDWVALGDHLVGEAELRLPALVEAMRWIGEAPGPDGTAAGSVRRVIDLGSGPGVVSTLLAESFPQAHVVAVDSSADLLEWARERAGRHGVGDRVETRQAQLPDDLATLGTADLIWAGNFVHHLGDQGAALARLRELLTPGGVLAVCEAGLPMRCLPSEIGIGRPGLQARLDAVTQEWFAAMRADLPGHVAEPDDWPGLLVRAGLEGQAGRSFLSQLYPPLDATVREHLRREMERYAERMGEGIADDDRAVLRRLAGPDDEQGMLRRPDAFYLHASTVHTARAPLG